VSIGKLLELKFNQSAVVGLILICELANKQREEPIESVFLIGNCIVSENFLEVVD
jgi:hypothetical protein